MKETCSFGPAHLQDNPGNPAEARMTRIIFVLVAKKCFRRLFEHFFLGRQKNVLKTGIERTFVFAINYPLAPLSKSRLTYFTFAFFLEIKFCRIAMPTFSFANC